MSGTTRFPNLARRKPFEDSDVAFVTSTCEQELVAAGCDVSMLPVDAQHSEVPNMALGVFGMWVFQRRWYYWTAKGPGIPVEVAERLHSSHGRQVRVDGHCMCPSPQEWFKGFGVGSYHVDSPAGLKALVDALRSVYDPAKDPDATPRTGKRS